MGFREGACCLSCHFIRFSAVKQALKWQCKADSKLAWQSQSPVNCLFTDEYQATNVTDNHFAVIAFAPAFGFLFARVEIAQIGVHLAVYRFGDNHSTP